MEDSVDKRMPTKLHVGVCYTQPTSSAHATHGLMLFQTGYFVAGRTTWDHSPEGVADPACIPSRTMESPLARVMAASACRLEADDPREYHVKETPLILHSSP